MEKKTNIYAKLLEFQKLGIAVEKNATNPHFKSRYPDLNEVLDKVTKPLNDMGIVIIQCPASEHRLNDEGRPAVTHGLRTTLYDTESGTEVSSFLPYVETTTAQKLGSCNTYNRRYALVTMLGLEDEDDDGNRASEPQAAVTNTIRR